MRPFEERGMLQQDEGLGQERIALLVAGAAAVFGAAGDNDVRGEAGLRSLRVHRCLFCLEGETCACACTLWWYMLSCPCGRYVLTMALSVAELAVSIRGMPAPPVLGFLTFRAPVGPSILS